MSWRLSLPARATMPHPTRHRRAAESFHLGDRVRITEPDGSTYEALVFRLHITGDWWRDDVTSPAESISYICRDVANGATEYRFTDSSQFLVEELDCKGLRASRHEVGESFTIPDSQDHCECGNPNADRVIVQALDLELKGGAVVTRETVIHDDVMCLEKQWTYPAR